ncbi:MAG: SCO family protein [Candidatus Baltobacteraceae bacterium]
MIVNALLAVLLSAIPVHGVILDGLSDRSAIVRLDPVTKTLPSQIRRFRFDPPAALRAGTSIDALLDRATDPPTLHDAVAAAAFAPGLPDPGRIVPVDIGSGLPAARLVDQNEHIVELDRAFRGKVLVLSFVFTRCPDRTLCPAISSKFAYIQAHLDPERFALAEITLDPQYDSPAVLREYGRAFGQNDASWTLLTGEGSVVQRLLDEFRISSMRVSDSAFLHDDKLFIVTPQGRVAYVVETGAWEPQAVIAQARSVAGLAANPFERFKLALIAGAIAMCGGSELAGIALLELSLFTLFTVLALAGMWLVARLLWGKHA